MRKEFIFGRLRFFPARFVYFVYLNALMMVDERVLVADGAFFSGAVNGFVKELNKWCIMIMRTEPLVVFFSSYSSFPLIFGNFRCLCVKISFSEQHC